MATQSVVKSAPAPPYCSGTTRPNSPRSPMACTSSTGKYRARSQRATCGATSRSAKSRTTLRKVSWSSDSSKLIVARVLDVYVNVKQADTVRTDEARTWTVRQLADEFGVTTRTLRFYEAEGLVRPQRDGTNRIYSQRDHARLRLILRGRRFGMSLPECREIVDMYDGAASSERRQLELLL